MGEILIGHWTKLGAAVRDTRARRGWSQHELATRAGVSRSWLAKVEAGHRGAELEQILRLLAALDLNLAVTDRNGSGATRSEGDEEHRTCEGGRSPSSREVGPPLDAVAALLAAHRTAAARRRASWGSSSASQEVIPAP